ncbi:MAG: tetratricopeptide repeat protein [Chthoniobacterales bacterium]
MTSTHNSTPSVAATRPPLPQRTWLRVLALFVCGFVARYPALHGTLIWDDQYLARDNPFMKSPLLIVEAFRHFLFPDSFSAHYRPLQHVSYFFDYWIWNENTYGYHLTNVLLHVGSGILLYFLLRHLLRALFASRDKLSAQSDEVLIGWCAFVAALLWIVHPVHSAAVDYISGRADSLAAFFACAAWLLYFAARRRIAALSRAALFGLAAVSALLALCSRETACIWLLLFLVYILAVERASLRAKLPIIAVSLAVALAYFGLRHLPPPRPAVATGEATPAAERTVLMLRALGDYTRLMFLPTNLHMDRTVEPPEQLLGDAGWRHAITSEYLSVLGLFAAAALICGAAARGKARALRVFGVGWFLLAYLPISNLIQLNATVAEHWLYLPSIGFILFVIGCCLELPDNHRKWLAAAAAFAVLALGARSIVRSGDWMNPETFYRQSLAAGATKARIALNLGQILTDKGEYAKAEPLLRRVVALNPDYPIARNALAHLLYKQGKTKEATEMFTAATAGAEQVRHEYPRTWIAALNVAHMRYSDHDLIGALAAVQLASRDYPGTWDLIMFESELLRQLSGPEAALPLVRNFARANWWHASAAIALGKLYSEHGDVAEAEAAFRHASRLDIHAVEALNLLALLELRQNRLDAAMATQRRAVSRQPDEPRQYLLLSDILEKMGRGDEARAALAQVSQLTSLVHAQNRMN